MFIISTNSANALKCFKCENKDECEKNPTQITCNNLLENSCSTLTGGK